MEKFTFFWSGPFSNWAITRFEHKGVVFTSSEQAMMYEKSMLFSDIEAAGLILDTQDPKKQKAIGRKIRNYDDDIWAEARYDIVKNILRSKFTQHHNSYETLMKTTGTTLVEASPLDTIWGIGLSENDQRALHRERWLGQNLLGQALTEIRLELEQK